MKRSAFLFSALALATITAQAAPSITGTRVLSTTTGVDVEVTGTGFGTTGPTVLLYDTFERGVIGSPVAKNLPQIGQWDTIGNAPNYVKDFEGEPAFSMLAPNGKQAYLVKIFPSAVTDLFVSYDVMVPPNKYFPSASALNTFSDSSSWKFSWLMNTATGYAVDSNADLCVPTHAGKGSSLLAGNNGNLASVSNMSTWWGWNEYNQVSYWQKVTSPTLDNGSYYFRSVNKSFGNKERKADNVLLKFSGTTGVYDRIGIPGWWRQSSGADGHYKNIYIATGPGAPARIELANNSTTESSTSIRVLPPKSWSDKKVVFSLTTTQAQKLNGRYLFIYDANGVKSATGVKVSLSAVSPPASPTLITQ